MSAPSPPVEGEREKSEVVVRKRRSWLTRNQIVYLVVLAIFGVLFVVYERSSAYHKVTDDDTASNAPASLGRIQPWQAPPDPPIQRVVAQPGPPPQLSPPAATYDRPAATSTTTASQGVQNAAMLAFQVPPIPDALKPHPAAARPDPPPGEHTSVDYKGETVLGNKAGPFGDSRYKLLPGLLRCTMRTAINSDIPGPFICTTPGPVFSDQCGPDGGSCHPLMAAGTLVVGKYDSKVANGQSRLGATGLQAYTPDHCVVPLGGAPMADTLGQAGLPGSVDPHFWERFGFALILTAVDVGTSLGQAALQKGGSTYLSFNGGGSGVGQFAQDVLRENMNIPPTIRVNQGSDVMVFLSQPTDFSECRR